MPKAIIEVYIDLVNELQHSDFLQSSFKVCKNYSHPHASYSQRFFKFSFLASTKMFWLVTCPADTEQK